MKHTVAVVDDHTLLSQAIGEMIDHFKDFCLLHTSANGQDLINKLKDKNQIPEVILMDVNMPVMNGVETTKFLNENYPDISVLALSIEEDEETILKMLRAGAKGYLVKDTRKEVLEQALLETIEKGYFHSNTVANLLINNLISKKQAHDFELKEREKEFIEYACSDMTYKQIAEKMFLSPKTIDNYRESVFVKLNVKNRIGLVLFAIKNGLVKNL